MSRDDYIEVSERVVEFLARYPEGCLQTDPPLFTECAGKTVVLMRAYAYRTPDDPRPGIGTAWELIPGASPFTRGSEVMVCETSAWGRAIVALGISAHRGVASADEVRAARARQQSAAAAAQVAADTAAPYAAREHGTGAHSDLATDKQRRMIGALFGRLMPNADPGGRTLLAQKALGKPDLALPQITKADAGALIDALTEWERTGQEPTARHTGGGTVGDFLGGHSE